MSEQMLPFTVPGTVVPLFRDGTQLRSALGHEFHIEGDIPRFVERDNYAASFGLEWNVHQRTQLDSVTGSNISRTRLERCLGASVESFRGRATLEAGCGAGRFTELLVQAGARVHSIDLSSAVDANRANIGAADNYVVAQADLRQPPFPPGSFDLVLCLGVLQHTPSPEESIQALWSMVRPGGWLVIDHYAWTVSTLTKLAPLYRLALLRLPPDRAMAVTDRLTKLFFPLHWAVRRFRPAQMLLSRVSPCLVYFRLFPDLTREQHEELTRLDTFDHLTDRFKHLRTVGQIRGVLCELGGEDVWVARGGNGIEARARRPA